MFRGRKDIVCPYLHERNEIDILCCNAGGGTLLVQSIPVRLLRGFSRSRYA
jgi:hypothetical protein